MKKNRITLGIVSLVASMVVILIAFQDCSTTLGSDAPAHNQVEAAAAGPLSISAPFTTIGTSQSVQISATGGQQPYTFSLSGCDSTVDPTTGYFVAATDPSVCEVTVTDHAGTTASLSMQVIIIQTSTLVLTATPNPATVNEAVTLTVTGVSDGTYTLSVVSGAGTLTGNVYQTPGTPETAVIEAKTTGGSSATVSILVTPKTASANAITNIQFIAVSPGDMSDMPWCPVGSFAAGPPFLVNWTTGSSYGPWSYSIFCVTYATAASTQVITALALPSRDDTAAGNFVCPTGYNMVATIHAVVNYGTESLCVQYGSPSTATSTLVQFSVEACNPAETQMAGTGGFFCYQFQ